MSNGGDHGSHDVIDPADLERELPRIHRARYAQPALRRGREHLILIGDSTLDNTRYLNLAQGERSVELQLLEVADSQGWQVTVLAQDGSTLEDVRKHQIPLIPKSTTHIVLSASGNDLLQLLNGMVEAKFAVSSMYRAVGAGMLEVAKRYRSVLEELRPLRAHVACCTVYQPNFKHLFFQSLASVCLRVHNSRLRQLADDFDWSIVDLAAICTVEKDFANTLELSNAGGAKVVWNIAAFLCDHPCKNKLFEEPADGGYGEQARRGSEVIVFGQDISLHAQCCSSRSQSARVYRNTNLTLPIPGLSVGLKIGSAGHEEGAALSEGSARPTERPRLPFSEEQNTWRVI